MKAGIVYCSGPQLHNSPPILIVPGDIFLLTLHPIPPQDSLHHSYSWSPSSRLRSSFEESIHPRFL